MLDSIKLTLADHLPRFEELLSWLKEWWVSEWKVLLDNRVGRWLLGPGRKTIYLESLPDKVSMTVHSDTDGTSTCEVVAEDYSKAALDRALSANDVTIDDIDLIVRLPISQFFTRKFFLPMEAWRNVDDVIQLDMSRKTPFRPNEVVQQYSVEKLANPDRLSVTQWIVKKGFIQTALSFLQIQEKDVRYLEADSFIDHNVRPRLLLNGALRRRPPWYWVALRLLMISSVLLIGIGFGLHTWHYQGELDRLDGEIAIARKKAQEARAKMDSVQKRQDAILRFRSEKIIGPGMLDIWQQVTETLPTNAWLSELRLDSPIKEGGQSKLTLTGFSEAASSLVGTFAKSGMFSDVSLTSPVSLDPTEQREHFSMQMSVHPLDSTKRTNP